MKKYASFFLIIVMVIFSLSGCHSNISKQSQQSEKLQIVTTIFPAYDWVREIIGDAVDNIELIMLLDNGVDLHSYQPTADDIIKISTCDMFIHVGGESDAWVEDALKNAINKDMVIINLMETLGDSVKEEEIVEGMQESEHHHEDEYEHDKDDESEHDHEVEYEHHHLDEHVWLSLKNAKFLCQKIASKLCEKDPQHKDAYLTNLSSYIEKLSDLDVKYQEVVHKSKNKTLLFGDRFPFRYLVDDYDLDYYAAFSGCSAETEASFETITFLSNKVDELGLTSVLKIEGTKHNIAETVISNTKTKDQQVLIMNSMQSITSNDAKNGTTYLSVMEQNLEVLKAALR
ncbi:metal ABC transporter substrate-binding protein [Lutispora thermophila]|uniref:Zinc transport system substrate-binding protein n=1 Tax=Lutispora thermophila DSM 19022 TaxID=1122184 RepID=A0A1M6J372_9FIRM|nr:metal ABC transporter substrate-binding protein [Lutispora thermophila]SHJ41146.1 zinc transport system substrate-binding protein [Lutispora thermophila DSM 19022]